MSRTADDPVRDAWGYGAPRSTPRPVGNAAQPERRMLLAILEDALDQLLVYGLAPPNATRSEPERWLFANDRKGPFSFVNVCETLNIDPQWLRDKVVKEIRSRKRRPAPPGLSKRAARSYSS